MLPRNSLRLSRGHRQADRREASKPASTCFTASRPCMGGVRSASLLEAYDVK